MYTRSPDNLYCRNGVYYATRNVPSDLTSRQKIRGVVSLHTSLISRTQKPAAALLDCLDRYVDSPRLESFPLQSFDGADKQLFFEKTIGMEFAPSNFALSQKTLENK